MGDYNDSLPHNQHKSTMGEATSFDELWSGLTNETLDHSSPPQPGQANHANSSAPTHCRTKHALQDYQMQLMLLEQQNKKRLMMARQEQEQMIGEAEQKEETRPPSRVAVTGGTGGGSETPTIDCHAQLGSPEQQDGEQMMMAQWEKQRMKTRLMAELERDEQRKGSRG